MIRHLYTEDQSPDDSPTLAQVAPRMSDDFDPYRKWLGIPPKDQPANHYRLLGIAHFEDDPDVIENAATRQIAHIRTFQNGKHASLSQKILNELSQAQLCLLQPDKKSVYDAQLRSELAAAGRLTGEIGPPPKSTTSAATASAPPPRTPIPPAPPLPAPAPPISGPPVSGPPMAAPPPARTAGANGAMRRPTPAEFPALVVPPVVAPPTAAALPSAVAPTAEARRNASRWRTDGEIEADADVAPVPIPMSGTALPSFQIVTTPPAAPPASRASTTKPSVVTSPTSKSSPVAATSEASAPASGLSPLVLAIGGVAALAMLSIVVTIAAVTLSALGHTASRTSEGPAGTDAPVTQSPSSNPVVEVPATEPSSTASPPSSTRPPRPNTRPAPDDEVATPFPIGTAVEQETRFSAPENMPVDDRSQLPTVDDSLLSATPEEKVRSELFQARSALSHRDDENFSEHIAEAERLIASLKSNSESFPSEAQQLREVKRSLDEFWTEVRQGSRDLEANTKIELPQIRLEFVKVEGSLVTLRLPGQEIQSIETRKLPPFVAAAIAFRGKLPENSQLQVLGGIFLLVDAEAQADKRCLEAAQVLFVASALGGQHSATFQKELKLRNPAFPIP